jgi:hypothetical protein
MPLLPITMATLYSEAARWLSGAGNRAGNRPYSTQPLSQWVATQPYLSQISRYKGYSISRDSQSTQFGPKLGNSDRFSEDFILRTQY